MNLKIPGKIKRLIKGRQWYHQRFDGSPLYLYFIAEAEIRREDRKPSGTEAEMRVSFFEKSGKGDWYIPMSDIERGSRLLINLAKKDKWIGRKLLRRWKSDEQKAQHFFDVFYKINLSRLRDLELLQLFDRYYKLFTNRFTSSAVIDHFALGTDQLIADMLRRDIGKINKPSDFMKAFSIVTAPVHQSFINNAEMDLLNIAINYPTNAVRIREYQNRYFWISNNYIDSKVLSVKHFKNEINIWLKSGADLRFKYRQLKNTPLINLRTKTRFIKKHQLSDLLKTLLKISEDFTWWQDERKKATYLNIYLGTSIIGEMARRRGYNSQSTKYLLPHEVKGMFFHGSPSKSELTARMKGSSYVVWKKGSYIVCGDGVSELRKLMFPAKARDVVKDIRGLTVSAGRVVGPVKIIGSAREVGKVQKGDILVAVMTRPDYITGIKKAAAIVTNEGGITCHAAIVARELGIPCIIATKIATEVLRDGDLVEVDANHGVVKVLNRR